MNGWGWVIWGYGIVLIVLAAYTWSLTMRSKAARLAPLCAATRISRSTVSSSKRTKGS